MALAEEYTQPLPSFLVYHLDLWIFSLLLKDLNFSLLLKDRDGRYVCVCHKDRKDSKSLKQWLQR